ncbi:MAG: carboxypeptidase-like regulatory domain-containing protein, partial [Alphaproteobacteria bacterium]
MRKSFLLMGGAVLLVGGLWYASQQGANGPGSGVAIDADDIGRGVIDANGPEAGVWVVAETNDLPTKFIRTVVTDDEGRYVIPDLPDASFDVWARGYGLVDSAKSTTTPGTQVNLEPTIAPDEATAAQI